ncbi:DUF3618 domain-containing protein [Marinibaculum pumilum]|uniref:DUF3618 domain-containing protein n=1 Tax=Marinibaculum pumilum TaxID=1766165 RepID=A0ABV7KV73_9PROT
MSDKYDTPDAIQRDIQRTREGLGRKLDTLQERLGPGEMAGEAIDYVKTTGAQLGSGVARTVRENPVPVALIGLGVGWLLFSSRGSRRSESAYGHDRERPNYGGMTYPDLPPAPGEAGSGSASGKVGAVAERVRHGVSEAGHEARHRAAVARGEVEAGYRQARDKAGHLAHEAKVRGIRAKDATGEFVDRNPLAVGALGLVAGAVIGAMLPATRKERQYVGPYREAAEHYADETAATAVRQGTERVTDASHALTDRLHAQVGDESGKAGSAAPAKASGGSSAKAGAKAAGNGKSAGSSAS